MKLRPDLAFLALDDELVVFSEETQCLMGLNASAAFVLHALRDETPPSELAKALASAGLAPAEAERWVTTAIEALGAHGMLADVGAAPGPALSMGVPQDNGHRDTARFTDMPPYTPGKAVAERRYRLLGSCTLVRFGMLEQAQWVDAALGHLSTDEETAPSAVLDIQCAKTETGHFRSNIYRDGKPVRYVPRLSMLGPIVKADLWKAAVSRHDFLLYIHAGVVGTGESCILLPAAAGSGKSSLTAALSHSGYRYFSDEVALIEQDSLLVPPVPLAICVKSTGWDVMARYYPELSSLPIHGREDGKVVRYVAPPAGAAQHRPAPVSHIVFPRYEAGAKTELKPVVRSEALRHLMDECLALRQRLNQAHVGRLVRWIAGIDCYALTFSSLEDAVLRIAEVAPRISS